MTYIELLNSFWDSTRFNPCSSNEATLYLYLLHQCNIRRWINPFEFKTRDLERALKISRATISAARDGLKEHGLIDYVKGAGSGSAVFFIRGAKVTNEELMGKFCVQSLNTKLNTTVQPLNNSVQPLNTTENICVQPLNSSVQQSGNILNTNQKHTLLNKRNKTDISPVGDSPRAPVVHSLFEEEENKAKKSKTPPRPKMPEPSPPTFDEVKAYFLSQRADERLENWEREAEVFFNHFSSLGWKTSSGAKITHWDSRANLWILEHEPKKTEKPIYNETGKSDRFSERRGSEPSSKTRKGFKGTF